MEPRIRNNDVLFDISGVNVELEFRAMHTHANRWYDVAGILWNHHVVKVLLSASEAAGYEKAIDYLSCETWFCINSLAK